MAQAAASTKRSLSRLMQRSAVLSSLSSPARSLLGLRTRSLHGSPLGDQGGRCWAREGKSAPSPSSREGGTGGEGSSWHEGARGVPIGLCASVTYHPGLGCLPRGKGLSVRLPLSRATSASGSPLSGDAIAPLSLPSSSFSPGKSVRGLLGLLG